MPNRHEIEAAKSERGGWTRAQLAAWGVPWPPPKGWKKQLEDSADARPSLLTAAERLLAILGTPQINDPAAGAIEELRAEVKAAKGQTDV
jgi:hypothetical protein